MDRFDGSDFPELCQGVRALDRARAYLAALVPEDCGGKSLPRPY